MLATDGRQEHVHLIEQRLANHPARARLTTRVLNMEQAFDLGEKFDIVHCYGLLHQLRDAKRALADMARHCGELLLLETETDSRPGPDPEQGPDAAGDPDGSSSGAAFHPSRDWLQTTLKSLFPYVYWPISQPAHEDFPLQFPDSTSVPDTWPRAIVIGSHVRLHNDRLVTSPPDSYVAS